MVIQTFEGECIPLAGHFFYAEYELHIVNKTAK